MKTTSVCFKSAALGCALVVLPLAAGTITARAQGEREKATKDVTQPTDTTTTQAAPLSEVDTGGTAVLSTQEAAFVKTAGQGNLAEIRMAQVALQNAGSDDVKEFARMMIKDHTEANDELGVIAKNHNVNFPTDPSEKDRAMTQKMTGVKGDDFDKAYMAHAVEDHTEDLAEYKDAKSGLKDPKLVAYNEKTEKVVAHHLQEAKKINAKVQKED